jgi:hypothetical protein
MGQFVKQKIKEGETNPPQYAITAKELRQY